MKNLDMTANKYFRTAFLDYFNNYLTIENYAEHNGISTADANKLIYAGRKYQEQYVKHCREAEETK